MKSRSNCLIVTVIVLSGWLALVPALEAGEQGLHGGRPPSGSKRLSPVMKDVKVTMASVKSVLTDTVWNLDQVRKACAAASVAGARLVFLPECMLTGHGGHVSMTENAEPVPEGPLSQTVIRLSAEHQLCIGVGIAERSNNLVYNSYMIADKGRFLGRQRKINLSGDEYRYFAAGEDIEVFDIGDIRFGVTICFDNHFPEIALLHSFHNVDLIVAAHADRVGDWPVVKTPDFCKGQIDRQQKKFEKMYVGTGYFHNVFVLACNAVGSATEGLEGVVSNHAGTVFGVDPSGEVFLRTSLSDLTDEIITVELKSTKRRIGHRPSQNRRLSTVKELFDRFFEARKTDLLRGAQE
jgi:predicted amidohydrolase